MPDVTLVCRLCGQKFLWTEKDEREYGDEPNPETEDARMTCPGCRVKQDGQRS